MHKCHIGCQQQQWQSLGNVHWHQIFFVLHYHCERNCFSIRLVQAFTSKFCWGRHYWVELFWDTSSEEEIWAQLFPCLPSNPYIHPWLICGVYLLFRSSWIFMNNEHWSQLAEFAMYWCTVIVFWDLTSGAGELTGTLCWPWSLFWLYCLNWKHTIGRCYSYFCVLNADKLCMNGDRCRIVIQKLCSIIQDVYCFSVVGWDETWIQQIHCDSKKQDTILLSITSPNVNRFSKFVFY